MPKRKAIQLTESGIKKLARAESGKRREVFDTLAPGLGLRVTDRGTKSWTVRYRLDGIQQRVTLGEWPSLGVEKARDEARAIRRWAKEGIDPKAKLKAEAGARRAEAEAKAHQGKTFADIAENYIARECPRLVNSNRTASVVNKLIDAWGGLPVSALRRHHLTDLTDDLLDAGTPAAANRAHEVAQRVFIWALDRGDVASSPFAGKKPPAKKMRRERALKADEIALLWPALADEGYPFGPWAQLLLLLGQRRSEVACMQWGEVDLDKAEWIIPAHKSKSRREHLIPLPGAAVAIFEQLPEFLGGPYIFTSAGGRRPVTGFARAKTRIDKAIREALAKTDGPDDLEPWVWHDLRRTCRTGLAELGVPEIVGERVLNHAPKNLAAVYNVFEYRTEKRDALERWARRVTEITTPPPANVVRLDRGSG